jgi:hypothetical protein
VKPFAAKLRSGQQMLGIVLTEADIESLQRGEPVVVDLASVGVGLWNKEADGSRSFLQPRDSNVLVMAGESNADIGELLQVNLSLLKKKP